MTSDTPYLTKVVSIYIASRLHSRYPNWP